MKKAKVFKTKQEVDTYIETLPCGDKAWWPVHYTNVFKSYYESRYNVELALPWGYFVRSVADDNAVLEG